MNKRDYYEVLGVGKSADENEVRKAYRKLAMQHHPDRNPDDPSAEDKFKEATEAYEVLKDPQKRQAYDQFGHAGVSGQGFGGGSPFGGGGIDLEEALRSFMQDFGGFDSFFGGGGRRRSSRPDRSGRDLRVRLKLDLLEVFRGVTRTVKIRKNVLCETCSGSGRKAGSRPSSCRTCQGAGEVRTVRRTLLGQFVDVRACPDCHGEGEVLKSPCGDCQGEGRVQGTETLTVKVPPGVSTGDYIPLRGQGEAGLRGGPAGDVIVVIEVGEHDLFERVQKSDLFLELPVSVGLLALGGKIEVPTLDGKALLKIPAGTQTHELFRLRGKGLPQLNSRVHGNLIVRLIIWTPQKPEKEEKELLKRLDELQSKRVPSPGTKN
ncbi:MAG: molecular chaperone DnaJ [Candidatus Krumholzibacteria bacterium]|jgi:molecular chaperone DnaJ|nr:molecular chaperone DnaJ [Candidatus Krumholzibacteria bacterium]MDP7022546.1 molecular chaperone DnaJ [Candidatus Krumholzibacteria bacterium]